MSVESHKRKLEMADTVASHYNQREDKGLKDREQSRIFFMRNCNNWIKSMLISDALERVRSNQPRGYKISVLDIGSGKGGDLLKWKVGGIDRLVCADIAEMSIEHCKTRFQDLIERSKRERRPLFSAQFLAADCSKSSLKTLLTDPNQTFDVTSCQFALHYSFETIGQAKTMLRNACECLKPGGLFIGTIPNANVLVKRLREVEGNSFGNDVYRVKFDVEDKTKIPLFGAKYDFFLEDAVNCPEFLVHFPLLQKMAAEQNMNLVYSQTFNDFHNFHSKTDEGQNLLRKMMALERFPPEGNKLNGTPESYECAEQFLSNNRCSHIGTLSSSEWEASNLYMVFMFQKAESTTVGGGE